MTPVEVKIYANNCDKIENNRIHLVNVIYKRKINSNFPLGCDYQRNRLKRNGLSKWTVSKINYVFNTEH